MTARTPEKRLLAQLQRQAVALSAQLEAIKADATKARERATAQVAALTDMKRDAVVPEELSLTQAALRIRVSYHTARAMMLRGEMEGRQVERLWYVRASDVERIAKRKGLV